MPACGTSRHSLRRTQFGRSRREADIQRQPESRDPACRQRMSFPGQLAHGALGNGCSAEQIQEILLLVAMYCGIPAANEAHRVAVEVLRENGAV